jgi:toxin ParE1/3/4
MSRHRFRIARRAATDLEEIADYIGQRNPSASDRVIDELFHSFAQLADNPDFGISLDELRPNLRMFQPSKPASKYLIFYYVVPDGVMISAVIHSARDWLGIFSQSER